MKQCHKCGTPWDEPKTRPGFADACPNCQAYLHACKNCRFHDPTRHNQCRVPDTEMVSNRAGMNYCDAFEFADTPANGAGGIPDKARDALDALFGEDAAGQSTHDGARDFLLGDEAPRKDPHQAFDDLFGDD